MNTQKTKAGLLEAFLRYWEDNAFMLQFQALATHKEPQGIAKHWAEFRKYARAFGAGDTFDGSKFIDGIWEEMNGLKEFPAILISWLCQSKRVFRLSREMQSRLSSIKLGNIRMCDITLPFPAFAVELNSELIDDRGSCFDFLLVSNFLELLYPKLRMEGRKISSILTFSSAHTTYSGISPEKKSFLLKRLEAGYSSKKDFNRDVRYLVEKIKEAARSISRCTLIGLTLSQEELAEDYIERLRQEVGFSSHNLTNVRTVLNLALYLQSLPSSSANAEGAHWKEEELQIASPKASFTKTANLCDIVGRHIIDSMMVDSEGHPVSGTGGWEAPPHWRRAHRRRPPGKGDDPLAEKTIKVRHTLVRADRIPEFEGVVGSLSEVKQPQALG